MRSSVLCAVLCTILASGTAAQGLTRVAPTQEPLDVFAREFRRDAWRAALLEPDLDRREENLDALLSRARLDPVARAFVEELARDPEAGELAWTARLALRELGRARFQAVAPLFGADPLGMSGRMDEMLQQFLNGSMPGQNLRAPRTPLGLESLGGRSVRVQQTDKGAKVEIVEEVDGKEERRTFEGASLQEILAANPELARDLGGLSLRVPPGQALDFGLGLPGAGRARGAAPEADGRTFATPLAPRAKAPILTDKLGVIVQPLTEAHAAELGLAGGQGLYVERVQAGCYAELLGVGSGDVLLELDGTVLKSPEDIERAMKARKSDAELELAWLDEQGKRHQETWKAR
jgi:hypothetical protein